MTTSREIAILLHGVGFPQDPFYPMDAKFFSVYFEGEALGGPFAERTATFLCPSTEEILRHLPGANIKFEDENFICWELHRGGSTFAVRNNSADAAGLVYLGKHGVEGVALKDVLDKAIIVARNGKEYDIRHAVADYIASEGCGCCSDREGHKIAEARLAIMLGVEKYADGSGFNFNQYKS
jgi:hypothetical protein